MQKMAADGLRIHGAQEIARWRMMAKVADVVGYHVGVGIWWMIVIGAILVAECVIRGI